MNKEENIILYHGSKKIIEQPKLGLGNPHNDYGLGFYCTQQLDLAKEWGVDLEKDGFANQYRLDMHGLKLLDLTSSEFTILHWLAILIENRTFDIQSDFGREAQYYLREHFLPDYEDYDLIRGYRADDSYFSFAQDFLNNAISLEHLSEAMHLGKLGIQIVLKSAVAFEQISFVDSHIALSSQYFPQKMNRDKMVRAEYFSKREEPWKRGQIYMMQILEEEMTADDLRI